MGITLYRTLSARTSPVRTLEKINAPPLPGLRLLAAALLCGVAAGTVLITQAAVPVWAAQGLAVTDKLRTLWDACYTALLPVLGLLAAVLLAGESACGQPFLPVIIFLRGFGIGAASGSLFVREGVRGGFLPAAVLVLPYGLATALLLIHAARKAQVISGILRRYLRFGDTAADIQDARRKFLRQFAICVLLAVISAGLQVVLLWLTNGKFY